MDNMKTLSLIQLGPGTVGKELISIIYSHIPYIRDRYGIDLRYVGSFRSKSGIFDPSGLNKEQLDAFNEFSVSIEISSVLDSVVGIPVLIDTTASDNTVTSMKQVLERGGIVIMANKKPLSNEYQLFESLVHSYPGRVYYETTVGAGLPIIAPLRNMLESGDTILSIEGCFSGTLGYVCSEMETGTPYGKAVAKAKELGFTEPDPRDDLSGTDVARKALILARMIGMQNEMIDISIEPFYDTSLATEPLENFLIKMPDSGQHFDHAMEQALQQGKTLRYAATIREGTITVGLRSLDSQSPIGSLSGPDNIVILRTERYNEHPLVVQGPGAGPVVTAAGLFGDLLTIIRTQL
ncbi:MAG: homoserine dehydrogenase [Patescibacteria group bacterium]